MAAADCCDWSVSLPCRQVANSTVAVAVEPGLGVHSLPFDAGEFSHAFCFGMAPAFGHHLDIILIFEELNDERLAGVQAPNVVRRCAAARSRQHKPSN